MSSEMVIRSTHLVVSHDSSFFHLSEKHHKKRDFSKFTIVCGVLWEIKCQVFVCFVFFNSTSFLRRLLLFSSENKGELR